MVLSLYFDVMLLLIEKRNNQQKKSKKSDIYMQNTFQQQEK